jgi:hypothetical protein
MEEEKVKKFVELYNKLCDHEGLMLNFVPQWKQSLDTGEYSLVIVVSIVEKPAKKE